ncbi:MAG: nucleotidyltransferase family protein [Terracidiphilus sp.]
MPADRERCELLRALVRRPGDDLLLDRLAKSVCDWDSLITTASQHGVLAMLFSRLSEIGTTAPPAAQERLEAEFHRNAFHSLANASELIAILKAFDRETIPAIPFKGVVLAATAYCNLTTRPAGDLDVLIHYRNLARASALMLERGYKLKRPMTADGKPFTAETCEYTFVRQSDGMVAEQRWKLEFTQPGFRRNLGLDWVWPERRTAMLAGAEVPDLRPEMTLLVLCMHGCKHAWSRLIWICDVAQLLESFPDLDWREVTREAKRSGLWRALALGVLLAHRVADSAVPIRLLQRFESDASVGRLARYIEDNLFDKPGGLPACDTPYYVQMLGFRDRIRFLMSRDFWRPNDRDLAAIQLPKSLSPLYYLVRPIRIFLNKLAR